MLELDAYFETFEANEVDLDTLRTLGDADLKALGVALPIARKTILAALATLEPATPAAVDDLRVAPRFDAAHAGYGNVASSELRCRLGEDPWI